MRNRSVALASLLGVFVLLPALSGVNGLLRAQEATEQATLDAEELGVSLARIKNKLDRLPDSDEERSLLRMNFYVEVYARAPQLDYFRGFDIHNSPVPHGPPMNTEMLAVMRSGDPQILPPAVNLNQILGWAWKLGR